MMQGLANAPFNMLSIGLSFQSISVLYIYIYLYFLNRRKWFTKCLKPKDIHSWNLRIQKHLTCSFAQKSNKNKKNNPKKYKPESIVSTPVQSHSTDNLLKRILHLSISQSHPGKCTNMIQRQCAGNQDAKLPPKRGPQLTIRPSSTEKPHHFSGSVALNKKCWNWKKSFSSF